MKKYLFLPALLIISSVANCQTGLTAGDFQKLNWLEGTWQRILTKPGRVGLERWEKSMESGWKGVGLTTQGRDTIFLEKLMLKVKDRNIYYIADVRENKEPTWFKLTIISEDGFSCENPEHDFPKKIVYKREEKKLKVTISGGGRSVDFLFEKQ
jgi:hypothetical protein